MLTHPALHFGALTRGETIVYKEPPPGSEPLPFDAPIPRDEEAEQRLELKLGAIVDSYINQHKGDPEWEAQDLQINLEHSIGREKPVPAIALKIPNEEKARYGGENNLIIFLNELPQNLSERTALIHQKLKTGIGSLLSYQLNQNHGFYRTLWRRPD